MDNVHVSQNLLHLKLRKHYVLHGTAFPSCQNKSYLVVSVEYRVALSLTISKLDKRSTTVYKIHFFTVITLQEKYTDIA